MRWAVLLGFIFSLPLWGADPGPVVLKQELGDTLWAVRDRESRAISCIIAPGWQFESSGNAKKPNIVCAVVLRDSLGKVVKLSYRTRLFGVDTSKVELRYTTEDSLPGDYRLFKYKLNSKGKFEKILLR